MHDASALVEGVMTGAWKSTAAITRIDFKCGGTAFVDGTIFSLYGRQ